MSNDVNLSDLGGSSGAGYDAIAYQMILDAISPVSSEAGWTLANRLEVFDEVLFNLQGLNITGKTAAQAFDNAADALAIAGNTAMRAYINNGGSPQLNAAYKNSSELWAFRPKYGPVLSSITHDGSFALPNNPKVVRFNSNGTRMYLVSSAEITQYNLSTPFDALTAVLTTKKLSAASPVDYFYNSNYNIEVSSDDTKLFVFHTGNLYCYTMSTPGEIDTATHTDTSPSRSFTPFSFFFSKDGMSVSFYRNDTSQIIRMSLSSPWDISSYVTYDTFNVNRPGGGSYLRDFFLSKSEMALYANSPSTNSICRFLLPSQYSNFSSDIPDADAISFNYSSFETSARGMAMHPDGEKFYLVGQTDDDVQQFSVGSIDYSESELLVAP